MKPEVRLLASAAVASRRWFAIAAVSSVAGSVSVLAAPGLLATALDAAMHGQPAGSALVRLAAALTVAVSCGVLRGYAGALAGAAAVSRLRRSLLQRVLAAGPATAAYLAPGDLASRVTGTCAQTGRTGLTVFDTVVSAATALGGVVALWAIDLRLALTFLLGLPIAVVIVRLFLRNGSPVFARYQELQASITARLVEAFGGARTIRASGTLPAETSRVLAPLPELAEAGYRTWGLQRATAWQIGLLLPMIEVCTLAVGGYDVLSGRITPGQLAAAVGYVGLAMVLFDQIDTLLGLAVAGAAAGRVLEVLRLPVPRHGTALLPAAAPDGRGVRWRDVTIRVDGRTILDAVDLDIPGGASVAVVGRSGTGKTSLAALVGRLRDPDAGVVLIDGVPVAELDEHALRRTVGYAFERPALFGSTIRDTVTLARPHASDDEVRQAARLARAGVFVERLPAGYETPLAQAPLSGGEAQRLGLARAFVHDAAVLVLDDATSSLDTATEAQVSNAFGALAGRTRIIVAHRAATAARSDLVAWLERGRIRALAPHEQLWADREYRALFASEADEIEEPA